VHNPIIIDTVITGDLIHSPLQARYTELSMRLDYDLKQSAATRRSSWRSLWFW
jgi:hypothetical protein